MAREAAAEAALGRERARSSDIWAKLAAESVPEVRRGEKVVERAGTTGSRLLEMRGGGAINSESREMELQKNRFEFLPEGEVFKAACGFQDWNHAKLPVEEFRVVNTDPSIRNKPKFSGDVCGRLKRGELAKAVEETFDGWVMLADQPGWVPRDMGGRDGIRECLQEIRRSPMLAVPEFTAGAPSRMMFEVVFEPRVNIMRQPHADATVLGSRNFGQFVLAESQTYHGWIRLADDLGWMQNTSQKHGQLLCSVTAAEHAEPMLALGGRGEDEGPTEEEILQQERETKEREILAQLKAQEIKVALEELQAAAASGEGAIFRTAMKAAKSAGVNKKDIARLNAQFSMSSC